MTNNRPDKQKSEINSSIEDKSFDLDGPLFGKDIDLFCTSFGHPSTANMIGG